MVDYVDIWDEYSIEFCKKLEYQCGGDWNKLDEDEQEIAALWKLVVDIYNGGFVQFFCNWGFDCYWYAMRGIQRIGDKKLLERLNSTYKNVFDKFKDDKRLTKYWDIPQYLTEEDEKILRDTDTEFWDKEGEILCKMAYDFYHDNLKKLLG
ncbi:MAG: DMP19 family protein [Ruminococcaceae bacterium]|nr:DMP19 family protein [Oscillospiraceae bacterium]